MANSNANLALEVTTKPLDQILRPKGFNARATGLEASTSGGEIEGESTTEGFKGLLDSITAQGQDTPCEIRPNTDKKTHGKFPWVYVTGYRRSTAVEILHKNGTPIPNLPKGHIRVQIRPEMSDVDAIALNLRENVERESLTAAETYNGVRKLFEADVDGKGGKLSQVDIVTKTGISQPYISKLAAIHSLPKPITKAWVAGSNSEGKGGPVHLPLETMRQLASQVPVERQQEVYDQKWGAKAPTTNDGASTGTGTGGENGEASGEKTPAWLSTAQEKAEFFGRQIGMLVNMGLFEGTTQEQIEGWTKIDWAKAVTYTIPNLGKPGKKAVVITDAQLAGLGAAMKAAYVLGRDAEITGTENPAGDEGDEDEDEEDETVTSANAPS